MSANDNPDFPEGQADMFGPAETPAYVPDPQHVRNRLVSMMEAMERAESWPWAPSTVRLYRETVWPQLLEKLGDEAEAAEWRARLEAETARLDRAEAA